MTLHTARIRASRFGIIGAALLTLTLLAPHQTAAQPRPARTTDEALALALQPDGATVVAGRALNALGDGTWSFALARYGADGALDQGFGRGGRVVTGVGRNGGEAYAVALTPDGGIVAAGRSFTQAGHGAPQIALAKYTASGELDRSFGTNGIGVVAGLGRESEARGVSVLADGRIVVAGTAKERDGGDMIVTRYLANGSLDRSFADGGVAVLDVSGGTDAARAVVVGSDGSITVGGWATVSGSTRFAVARLTPDGALDQTFGGGGVTFGIDGRRDAEAHALALTADGGLVLGGFTQTGFGKAFALARLTSAGVLDRTFGGGVVRTSFCSGCFNDVVHGVAVDADGGVIAAGHSARASGFVVAMARYLPDGTLDRGFGAGGLVSTSLGGKNDWANAVTLGSDGTVTLAGQADPTGTADFAVLRYGADGAPDTSFGDGRVITDIGGAR